MATGTAHPELRAPAPRPASSPSIERSDADAALVARLFEEVLAEQGGAELLAALHAVREAAGAARAGDPSAGAVLAARIAQADAPLPLIRACTIALALDNTVDEVREVRRTRAADRAGGQPPPESLREAAARVHGRDAAGLALDVRLVLTAHPTDMARRSVLGNQRRVAEALEQLDDPRLGDSERRMLEDEIREAIATWWSTSEVRGMRPRVLDEVRRKLFFFESALYDAAGELAQEYARVVGEELAVAAPPVRFGSWAGADMDGNPHVGPRTIRETLRAQRTLALSLLLERLRPLRRHFAQSDAAVGVSDRLQASLARDERELPDTVAFLAARYPHEAHEPLRRKLAFVAARLEHTLAGSRGERAAEPGYASADDLLDDLEAIRESVSSSFVARGRLDRLMWQVRIFGFHLATLEARDNAPVLHEACRALLPGYAAARTEQERTGVLTAACLARELPWRTGEWGSSAQAAACFDTIAAALALYGPRAIDTFIVSNAEQPSDILCALWLARLSGLFDPGAPDGDGSDAQSQLEIVPLFERRQALRNATDTLAALYGNPAYRRHLDARHRGQEVMLGYSDAGKDEGFLAAQWTLYEAQEALARQARAADVNLRLFHGRGGSPPRGGGPAYRVILAQPPGTVGGRIKITEQGEVVTAKFSHRRLAVRSLEQTVAAVVHATVDPGEGARKAWRSEMARLADAARGAYDELVVRDGDLVSLLREVTPVDLLDELNIGSRPASRGARRELSELRAIPWVFAWMQNRIGLPSWYGAGTALAAGDLALQREMHAEWPFFRGLVETLEGAVASSDLAIGARYFDLAGDGAAAARVWDCVRDERERCAARLLAITGREALAPAGEDRLAWLDVLSHFQLALLARHRAGDPFAREPLLATVAGIATGVRTTG